MTKMSTKSVTFKNIIAILICIISSYTIFVFKGFYPFKKVSLTQMDQNNPNEVSENVAQDAEP